MHTHTVFFWLNEGLDAEAHDRFAIGLDLLTRAPQVRDRRIGRPATTRRDVVDWSYAFGIVLRFDDKASHDAYQVGPEHDAFVETCFDMIARVQVYDIDEIAI